MLPSTSRQAAAQLQLTLRLTSSTTPLLRFRLPAFLAPSISSSSSSTSYPTDLTPALATSPAASASTSSSNWSLGSLLWDGLLRAVPKKKVSHSRKSMRSANKGLKDRVDLVHCSACGKPKLHHHVCGFCYAELNRARKVALRGEGEGLVRVEGEKGVQKSLNPHQQASQ